MAGKSSKLASTALVNLLLVVLAVFDPVEAFSPVTVETKAVIPGQTPDQVQSFLASPANWPKIVATSVAVSSPQQQEQAQKQQQGAYDLDQPLPVGATVDEIFGLPPLLPLCVSWACTKNVRSTSALSSGRLEFYSPEGLPGVAEKCEMLFDFYNVEPNGRPCTQVVLNMKYQPVSFLALLAVPILTLDNAAALKLFLPAALRYKR